MRRVVRQKAARWLVRMLADDVTADEQAAFVRWINADPKHAEAYTRLEAAVSDAVRAGRQLRAERAAAPSHVWRTPMWRPFVVTGGVALAACGAFAIWASSPEQFGAAIGQRREVVLWDGSVVELNTNTEIEATPLGFLAGGPRRIRLARGEALFTVAHNGAAFDVATDGALVHATGTVFSVRRESDGVTVTVNEGSVEASLSAPRLGVALQAGQVLAARPQGISLHVLSDAELSRRQAWLQGRLAFDGESLAEVTEEVSRYTGAHFSFGDPDIGALPIVAYFKANDLDAFLGQLEANNATLRISRNGEDVRIERRR